MSNFIKMQCFRLELFIVHHRLQKKIHFMLLRQIKKSPNFVNYLSLTWLCLKKNSPFLKGSRPRVSKRDSTIPLYAVSYGMGERRIERERERDCERSKNKRKRWSKLYPRFLSIAVRIAVWLFTSERTGRSIRNVVSLSVEVASAFWQWPKEAEGGNDSHFIGFLLLFPYLLRLVYSTLSLPVSGIELVVSRTLMPYSHWILRLCLAHNGFCFERNFVVAVSVYSTP